MTWRGPTYAQNRVPRHRFPIDIMGWKELKTRVWVCLSIYLASATALGSSWVNWLFFLVRCYQLSSAHTLLLAKELAIQFRWGLRVSCCLSLPMRPKSLTRTELLRQILISAHIMHCLEPSTSYLCMWCILLATLSICSANNRSTLR
jgi:hypothetical protein